MAESAPGPTLARPEELRSLLRANVHRHIQYHYEITTNGRSGTCLGLYEMVAPLGVGGLEDETHDSIFPGAFSRGLRFEMRGR